MAITDGLLRIYHFNGDFKDSWGGKDFTAYGAVIDSTNKKLGNGSVSFDGIDDYLQADDAGLAFGSIARTINCWIYRRTDSGNVIFFYGNQNANGYLFAPFMNASSGYYLAINFEGHVWGVNTNVVPLNTWKMLTFVFPANATSSDASKIYVDAVLQTSTTLIGTPVTVNTQQAGNCKVGTNPPNTEFANMLVDELCFWNRALTDAEIGYLYNNGLGREIGFGPSPWLYNYPRHLRLVR